MITNIQFDKKIPVQMTTSPLASLRLSTQNSDIPGYQQLQQAIQQAIRSGSLPAGSRLPSSRLLAAQLGVSRSMVVQAYDLLVCEGYLDNRPRSGLLVAATAPSALAAPSTSPALVAPALRTARHFDAGADVSQFPARSWANCLRRAWLHPDPRLLQGQYHHGHPLLRAAIARLLFQLRGLQCQPEQIVITAGNRDGLMLLQHSLHQHHPNHRWCIEDPCYPPVRQLMDRWGCEDLPADSEGTCLPVSSTDWLALVTPNRHYPLGLRWSNRRRQQWLQAAIEQNGVIIEDDYDTEFIYNGQPGLPLMQLAQNTGIAADRVCLVGSFSKILFRGLRLGYLVVPPALMASVHRSQQQLGDSASQTMQPALADFIDSGELARHLNRMRRHYRKRRDHLHHYLLQTLSPWFDWVLPDDGMQLLLYWKSHLLSDSYLSDPGSRPDLKLATSLALEGIEISLLADHYRHPQQAPAGIRMGFTGTSESETEQLVDRIAATLLAFSGG